MLKLKGQTESGEWVEFWVCDIAFNAKPWTVAWCISSPRSDKLKKYDDIRTATIRPADDPRKAMLAEIRKWLGYVQRVEDKANCWGGYSEDEVDAILDEMEAKL